MMCRYMLEDGVIYRFIAEQLPPKKLHSPRLRSSLYDTRDFWVKRKAKAKELDIDIII
jgi:hypothetical protein